jgi:hypothetical protein
MPSHHPSNKASKNSAAEAVVRIGVCVKTRDSR